MLSRFHYRFEEPSFHPSLYPVEKNKQTIVLTNLSLRQGPKTSFYSAYEALTKINLQKDSKTYTVSMTLPEVNPRLKLGFLIISNLYYRLNVLKNHKALPSPKMIRSTLLAQLFECYYCLYSRLEKRKKVFYFPNLKGVCNRLQIFSGLYVLSAYFSIPVISE